MNPQTKPFLGKNDLIALHKKTGDILHKGNLRSVINKKSKIPDSREVDGWLDKIVNLLNAHTIHSIADGKLLHCHMHSKAPHEPTGSEKVRVYILEPIEPAS